MRDYKDYVEGQGKTFPVPSDDFYTELAGFLTTATGMTDLQQNDLAIVDDEILFIKTQGLSNIKGRFMPREQLMEVYENWEGFAADQRQKAPDSLNHLVHTSKSWINMPTELAFVRNTIQGIIIAIFFAFLILMVATRNYIVSLMSIACVTMVVVSIVGIMHMNGQQLGTAESISIVILIGFSVDYTVHLAADYVHSAYEKREDKMKQAFREMGISIFSGFITTFGCGCFLFFGNFTFF